MRLATLALIAAFVLTACGTADKPEAADTSIPAGLLSPDDEQALKDADTSNAPDAVFLWSLCGNYAKTQVSGKGWRFGYPADAKVSKIATGYKVTGSVPGPADQTFTLSCSYKDVTKDGATRTAYNLE